MSQNQENNEREPQKGGEQDRWFFFFFLFVFFLFVCLSKGKQSMQELGVRASEGHALGGLGVCGWVFEGGLAEEEERRKVIHVVMCCVCGR